MALAARVSSPSTPTPSRYEQDFETISFLGRGAFGEVLKARNRLDGKVYAVKGVQTDVYGKTYLVAHSVVLGRTMNADLKRLGF